MKVIACLSIVAILALGCEDEKDRINKATDNSLSGTWLYTEYGYSPGAGYITEIVPTVPPQTIIFNDDLTLLTNIEALKKYHFYRIFEDSTEQHPILALYKSFPGSASEDISDLEVSYSIALSGDSLKLHYRWCFEGCHLGFRKLSDDASK